MELNVCLDVCALNCQTALSVMPYSGVFFHPTLYHFNMWQCPYNAKITMQIKYYTTPIGTLYDTNLGNYRLPKRTADSFQSEHWSKGCRFKASFNIVQMFNQLHLETAYKMGYSPSNKWLLTGQPAPPGLQTKF